MPRSVQESDDRSEQQAHLLDEHPLIEEDPMPTFNDPIADAGELHEAVRGLTHATRRIQDPTSIYPVLGSISSALASLTQALHQLGDFHDGPARKQGWMNGDPHAGRAASYKASWELHRAAEMVHQVAESVDRAHELEATIAYDTRDYPRLAAVHQPACDNGLSL